MQTVTLAAGCFWCTQAIFERLKGVKRVVAGYAGGYTANPTYKDVTLGDSGHVEAVQITFDPEIMPFEDLLYVFWRIHDPTTKDRQDPDVGPQYRSVIFYHSLAHRKSAIRSKMLIEMEKLYRNPIITEIIPFKNFYKAEGHHQNYYQKNPASAYCKLVVDPKIQKLQQDFKDYLA